MDQAPVIVFAFNRPAALDRVLKSLQECEGFASTHVIITIDGPRDNQDHEKVENVKKVANSFSQKYENVAVITKEHNLGLAASIRDGVGQVCREYGRAIVVEDDLILSKCFIKYMNDALDLYEMKGEIKCINAYVYGAFKRERDSCGFIRFSHPWGWATWNDRWSEFDQFWKSNAFQFAEASDKFEFDLGGIESFSEMLEDAKNARISSWWIRWYFYIFQSNGFGVFPPKTLVKNVGIIDDPTHFSISALLLENQKGNLTSIAPKLPLFNENDHAYKSQFIASMKPRTRKFLRRVGSLKRNLLRN